DRDVGAGADRYAEVGLDERGGIVNAVSDHRDGATFGLQAADLRDLVLRQNLGEHAVDADLDGYGPCGLGVVARDHRRLDVERVQLLNGGGGVRLERVADGERATNVPVPARAHAR